MRRTMIITLECADENHNAWRIIDNTETDLLDYIGIASNCHPQCEIYTELTVVPLSDLLISDLCNTQPSKE